MRTKIDIKNLMASSYSEPLKTLKTKSPMYKECNTLITISRSLTLYLSKYVSCVAARKKGNFDTEDDMSKSVLLNCWTVSKNIIKPQESHVHVNTIFWCHRTVRCKSGECTIKFDYEENT